MNSDAQTRGYSGRERCRQRTAAVNGGNQRAGNDAQPLQSPADCQVNTLHRLAARSHLEQFKAARASAPEDIRFLQSSGGQSAR
jgi:hypothetical protein